LEKRVRHADVDGLKRGIPAITSPLLRRHRVRRFLKPEDYFTRRTPDPANIWRAGRRTLQAARRRCRLPRATRAGTSTDIMPLRFPPDLRHATAPRPAGTGRATWPPLAVIYSHVWFDFPHTRHEQLHGFSGLDALYDRADPPARRRRLGAKPISTERWYGGFRLADSLGDLHRVRIVADATDSLTTMLAPMP